MKNIKQLVLPKATARKARRDSSLYFVSKAFTLIEILVVTVAVILLSGLSLAYYNNLSAQKDLDAQAQKMVDVLELAKKKASAAEIAATCNPDALGVAFSGYQVSVSPNTTPASYALSFCCQSSCAQSTQIEVYKLPSSVSIIQPSTAASVQFLPLSAGTNLSSFFSVILKSQKSSECIDILINTKGSFSKGSRVGC